MDLSKYILPISVWVENQPADNAKYWHDLYMLECSTRNAMLKALAKNINPWDLADQLTKILDYSDKMKVS